MNATSIKKFIEFIVSYIMNSVAPYPIILIGGLGTNTYYMEHFCGFLRHCYGTHCHIQILNFPLNHGETVEQEVAHILKELGKSVIAETKVDKADDYQNKYNIIGFSAGCSVALTLAKFINHDKIILCNPADIRHRFYKSAVDAIYDYSESCYGREIGVFDSFLVGFWFVFFCLLGIIWNLLLKLNMTGTTMWLYYGAFGKRNYDSAFTELQKNTRLFDEPFEKVAKTISECVIKPDLTELVQPWAPLVNKVHVVYGLYDVYLTYIIKLKAGWINTNVLFHEVKGSHNMINLNPEAVAQSVFGIL